MSIKDHPLWITAGTIAAACALWLGPTDAQRRVCATDLVFGSRVGDVACKEEFRAIQALEATATVDSFLGRASGARPMEAWDMLSPSVQSRFPAGDFKTDWNRLLWAERVGNLEEESGRNSWLVTFRSYAGKSNESSSGDVNTMTMPIELTRQSNGSIQVTNIRLPNRIDAREAWVHRDHPRRHHQDVPKTFGVVRVAGTTIRSGSLLRTSAKRRRTAASSGLGLRSAGSPLRTWRRIRGSWP